MKLLITYEWRASLFSITVTGTEGLVLRLKCTPNDILVFFLKKI